MVSPVKMIDISPLTISITEKSTMKEVTNLTLSDYKFLRTHN